MLKREIRRNFNKFGKYLEPFEVLALLLIFIFPVLAVVNLSPQTGVKPALDEDVLGLTVTNETTVEEVGGTHEFIKDEHLYTKSSTEMEYQATLLRRNPGIYTKPILSIKNPSSEDLTVRFTLMEDEISSSQIGIMRDNINHVLKYSDGEKFYREFVLEPGEDAVFHIDVRDELKKNFEETIQIQVNLYGIETEDPSEEQNEFEAADTQDLSGTEIETNVPLADSESPNDFDLKENTDNSQTDPDGSNSVEDGSGEDLEQYEGLVELQ